MRKCFCLLSVITVTLIIAACNGKKPADGEETNIDTVNADSIAAMVEEQIPTLEFDSVKLAHSDQWFDYTVDVVLPNGSDYEAIKNMRQVILRNFGIKNATGEEDFKQTIVGKMKNKAAEAKSDLEEMSAYADEDEEFGLKYSYEDDISVDCITNGYVTFESMGDDYRAGAHGMPWHYRFSVNRSTGKALKWADIIKPTMKSKLKPILKKAVVDQYFNGDKDIIDGFDLPGAEPALTPNGVWFGWGAYEIACYAAGMPECVVDYEKLQDYLTDTVKEIVRK